MGNSGFERLVTDSCGPSSDRISLSQCTRDVKAHLKDLKYIDASLIQLPGAGTVTVKLARGIFYFYGNVYSTQLFSQLHLYCKCNSSSAIFCL